MRLIALLTTVESFFVYKRRKLPYGQTVNVRNLVLTDEGMISVFDTGTFHFDTSQGIGTVKNHHFYSLFRTGPHNQSERADECI